MLFSERFEAFIDGCSRCCSHPRCRWLNLLFVVCLWLLGILLILLGTLETYLPPAVIYIGISILNIGLIVTAYECCVRKRLPNTMAEEVELDRLLQSKRE